MKNCIFCHVTNVPSLNRTLTGFNLAISHQNSTCRVGWVFDGKFGRAIVGFPKQGYYTISNHTSEENIYAISKYTSEENIRLNFGDLLIFKDGKIHVFPVSRQ